MPPEYAALMTMARSLYLFAAAALPLAAQTLSFTSLRLSAGTSPKSIQLADFNGDKNIDIAVVNASGMNANHVTVLLGNGAGGFGSAIMTATGQAGSTALAVADFNKDKKQDIAVVNNGSSTVSILFGNGDGTFTNGGTYPTGSKPVAIAAADFRNNGQTDLAVVNSDSGNVTILLGKKGGLFKAGASITVGSAPSAVNVGDFNHDGIPDLAVANGTLGEELVMILLGNGDGTFRNVGNFAVHSEPNSVAVGDLNGDGILDLAVANIASSDVSVLLGNGDGTFKSAVDYAAGNGPAAVKSGDFAANGIADLVACANAPSEVLVYAGSSTGVFQTPISFPVPGSCNSVAVGTFVKKGKPDIAAAYSGGVLVLLNTTE